MKTTIINRILIIVCLAGFAPSGFAQAVKIPTPQSATSGIAPALAAQGTTAPPPAGAPAGGQAAAKPEEPPPPLAVPPGYKYESRGRRDPFINPVPKPVAPKAVEVAMVRPSGAKGLLLSEVQVIGVISSSTLKVSRAVLLGPGGKTYSVNKGDSLFDAVVKDIQSDGVVFELKSTAAGAERDVVRKLKSP